MTDYDETEVDFSVLQGLTIDRITNEKNDHDNDELIFYMSDGREFKMYHAQRCCESIELIDTAGDFSDIIGTSVLLAECVTNDDDLDDVDILQWRQMWTFYKLSTIKGSVTLRWFGRSNGCYSVISAPLFEITRSS